MHVFKHPNYYKRIRAANKDQAISSGSEGSALPQRAPGPGLKQQATSNKRQAPSSEKNKPQAPSPKRQASS